MNVEVLGQHVGDLPEGAMVVTIAVVIDALGPDGVRRLYTLNTDMPSWIAAGNFQSAADIARDALRGNWDEAD